MKLRHHHGKCCSEPDIKDEGCVETEKGISWEYHCYHCDKTWTEIEPYKKSAKKVSKKKMKLAKQQTCEACKGMGFILAEVHRFCHDSSKSYISLEIQRCDNCFKYKTDNKATEVCYKLAQRAFASK